jgi:hypothetical protein
MGIRQGIFGLLERNQFAQITPDSLRLVRKLVRREATRGTTGEGPSPTYVICLSSRGNLERVFRRGTTPTHQARWGCSASHAGGRLAILVL